MVCNGQLIQNNTKTQIREAAIVNAAVGVRLVVEEWSGEQAGIVLQQV